MKIAVLGAGSLGCVFGGMLSQAGHEVTLVNRSRDLVTTLNSQGLVLRTNEGDQRIDVTAATDCQELDPVDLLIVLVKSSDTLTALRSSVNAIGPETVILSLQNGLGHEDIIASVAGDRCVLTGKTYVGGTMVEPGVIVAGYEGRLTHVGATKAGAAATARLIAAAFSDAGLPTIASDDITQVVWDKLLVNVATGALSAITGLAYGKLYSVPEIENCAIAAVEETMAVARASGIRLSTVKASDAWTAAGQGLPPGFKASMLQSLEKGRRTEIDFVNGAVVEQGRRLGVPTPVNSTLVAAVKGLELELE